MVETELAPPTMVDESTQTEIEHLESWTKTVTVASVEDRARVYEAVASVKSMKNRIVAFFRDSKEKAHATWKSIVANEKGFTDRLDAFEAAGKRAIVAFDQTEERKRIEEQRRLQAIADEAARKEREKQEAEARRQRQIEQEAREKAEAMRKAAEAANAEEKARLLREAETADRKAAAANVKAETREENAASVIAPVVQVATVQVKAKGESTRAIWKARVVDVALVPREYMIVNEKALDGIAKATKGSISIAGIEFYSENSLSVKA